MEIIIANQQDQVATQDLESVVQRALITALGMCGVTERCEVSVTFVDNAAIQELNRRYRSKDSSTDVLSFPQGDEDGFTGGIPEASLILGDIVISLEKAAEQSKEFGHSIGRETAFLAVHGCLHLLGYDHDEEMERQTMRELEECVMAKLGLTR